MSSHLALLDEYTIKEIYRIIFNECLKEIVPTEIDKEGNFYWKKNKTLHRDCCDQPAYIGANGTQKWFRNGDLQRNRNLPIIIGVTGNGTYNIYKNGDLHIDRPDEPGNPIIITTRKSYEESVLTGFEFFLDA